MIGPVDLDPAVVAMLALRLLIVAVVVGLIVRGYLRRRRRRERTIEESQRWLRDEDGPEDEDGDA
jgi:flagellar biosynthesis/type III secretory pathway M-ring protein FliF/YscJ